MTSLIATLTTLMATLTSAVFSIGMDPLETDHSNLGELHRFEMGEVYFKGDASAEDARRLGDYLLEIQYFGSERVASVQLEKTDNRFLVRFVVNEQGWTDTEIEDAFRSIKLGVQQEVFEGANFRCELCDTNMNFKKMILESIYL